MPPDQSFNSHRRFYPPFHFFIVPVLVINLIVEIVRLMHHPSMAAGWALVVAAALLTLGFVSRINALVVQNRLIRLEETLRLGRLLPEDLRGRVGELRTSQLIALRFCDDSELEELTRMVLSGEVRGRNQIKRRIRTWRPDLDRV